MSKSAEVESMQRKRYKLEDFAFDLPESLLAITPSMKRDACRLMKIDTEKETLQDGTFTDIVDELEAGDVLVLNDTKVSNIRMFAQRKNKGSTSTFEVLLLKSNIKSSDIERAMVRPQKRLHLGDELEFAEDLTAKVISIEKNEVTLHFSRVLDWEDLDKYGKLPMPLYIVNARKKRSLQTKGDEFDQIDKEYYQTVFSSQEGSHAAPTAGLHFTKELLEKLEN